MRVAASPCNTGGSRNTGKFFSHKMGNSVTWKSPLERDYYFFLEIDSDVISYQARPLKIEYELNGRAYDFIPGVRVIRHAQNTDQLSQLIALKRASEVSCPEFQSHARILTSISAKHDYKFQVITDAMICSRPLLDNIKRLYRYAGVSITPDMHVWLFEQLRLHGSMTLGELIEIMRAKRVADQYVYSMLYRGLLKTDLSQPLSAGSVVFFPEILLR